MLNVKAPVVAVYSFFLAGDFPMIRPFRPLVLTVACLLLAAVEAKANPRRGYYPPRVVVAPYGPGVIIAPSAGGPAYVAPYVSYYGSPYYTPWPNYGYGYAPGAYGNTYTPYVYGSYYYPIRPGFYW